MTNREMVTKKYPSARVIPSMTMGEDRGGGDYDQKACFLVLILSGEHFAELGVEKVSTGSRWILGYGDNEEEAWKYAATRDERLRGKWKDFMLPYISDDDIRFTADRFREKYTVPNRQN